MNSWFIFVVESSYLTNCCLQKMETEHFIALKVAYAAFLN